ncbi:sigma-70 family RNA polymerase sigma factor [Haloferula sp. A504]|uniref:sigma-70 family RNA polymerase sigma factor n=1 Tax=Haloferula sp. A504 TaxID=3373601 RepID=UPI0031C3E94C|nr:sigma-70 family RNA polymerase sigma factor [Verrucomicrobiaceae bacterium E54]
MIRDLSKQVGSKDPDPGTTRDDGQQLQEFVQQLTASQTRIHAFIASLMPGSPDVSDVLQETNLTLWGSRGRYRPGSNFLAWAFSIARYQVLTQQKRDKRNKRLVLSSHLLDLLAEEVPTDESHDAFLRALEGCKSKLTQDQRDLIDARYRPGHSLESLAQRTGRKASALRVALMRIRISLRECIERTLNERPA